MSAMVRRFREFSPGTLFKIFCTAQKALKRGYRSHSLTILVSLHDVAHLFKKVD